MKVLILGGTGTVGLPLVKSLLADGIPVSVLTRNAESARKKVHSRAQVIEYSDFEDFSVFEKVGKISKVINLAGANLAEGRWTAKRKEVLVSSRIESTRFIVSAIEKKLIVPEVLINASAIGYYSAEKSPSAKPVELTESSSVGEGFLSSLCDDWETEAQKAEQFGVRVVCGRLGAVLSAAGGALEKMIPIFRLNLGGKLGSGRQWFSWIHVNDAVDALKLCMKESDFSGCVNIVSPNPVSNTEFTRELAGILNKKAIFSVPGFVLKLALGEMSQIVLASQKVIPAKLLSSGFDFNYKNIQSMLKK